MTPTRRRAWYPSRVGWPRAAALVVAVTAASCSTGGAGSSADGSALDGSGPTAEDPTTGGTGGDSDADPERETSPAPTPTIEADFVDGPCGFEVPPGTSPRCGTVSVPEEWATGEGSIDLAVAVFPSTADAPAPDPVVYLEGGPGGHALETLRFASSVLLEPLLDRGDVIVFDQRGAGLSRPSLACDEITEVTREVEDTPGLAVAEVDERFHTALGACSTRLSGDGIDLGAYTSINNAHDVEAIRVALGYDEWNLHGISYGTRLALETLRHHPDNVRAVVLDSVFPPQVDSALENPGTFLASFEAVVAACAAEAACAAGGDLGDRLAAVVERYEQDPARVDVRDLFTGQVDEISLEGETIIGIVTQALYSPLWFGDLPELVGELEAGDVRAVELFLSQQRVNEQFLTDGMFYAFDCNEEVPFADRVAVEAALPPDPFGLRDRFNYASNNGTNAFGTCEAFGSTPADSISNEPVVSDVPALVMAGRFDPVTPVSWAEAAAEHLANSHLVVDPFNAHGVSPGACGMAIVTTFLDDPTATPDTSCIDDGDVRFLDPPDSTVTLETTVHSTSRGAELTTVRPEGWTHGGLPGDSYRQGSFLDPTQLIQVADDPLLGIGLELYLSETYGVQLGPAVARPDLDGRDWTQRTGRSEVAAAEWYEIELGGATVFVILVSTPDELEANIETILLPALDAIELS